MNKVYPPPAISTIVHSKRAVVAFFSFFLLLFCAGQKSKAQFSPGNIAVFVAAGNSSNTQGSIVEFTATGTGITVHPIPDGASTANGLRFSGSGISTAYLANSNDGTLLAFTGANSSNTSSNVNALNPRGVGAFNGLGIFNLATTYTGGSNQTKAATTVDNALWYISEGSGIYTNGSNTANPAGNFKSIKAFGGIVYLATAVAGTIQVNTISAPTGGTLSGLPGLTANANIQDFYLVSSGSNGAAFDVLYVVSATSNTDGTISKYSLVNGTWASNGSYTTTFGGSALAAKKAGGGAALFVSTGQGALAANNVTNLTDATGYNTTINITSTSVIYTAATGTIVKGVAFAPVTPAVNLSVSSNTGSETAATAITVTATASYPVSVDQTVSIGVSGTGITAGDYTLSNSTIIIPAGQTTGSATFTVVDDAVIEGTETAIFTISSPSSGITLGGTTTQNITITDNDIASVLTFVRADTTVLESTGIGRVYMRVTTAGNVAGSVNLSVSSYSTATGSGTDYSVPVTLNIPANVTLGQLLSFDFTINDDGTAEADEYVICKTTNAVNASVSGTTQSTLYIKDNDKATPTASNQLALSFVSSFSNGASGTNSAEISAYDSASKRIFIANSIANRLDIVNFANPAAPVLISSINLGVAPFNGAINSVDVFNGTVALALEGLTDKQANGKVVFTDINGTYISEAAAGAMPDMITFNHAGTKVYTANEGEPNAAYTNDPVGSISVIDISGGVASPTATNIGFTAYNGQETALRSQGIRIYGVTQPGSVPSTAAQDFEPEYITISDDDGKAWVTLQENNALVELDLSNNTIVKLIPLGYKDHSDVNNPMDVSDQTFGINLSNFNVKGMYEPDAISHYTSDGNLYLLTANEGDSRAYTGFSEETRVNAAGFVLDPTAYPNAADLKNNSVLGRLTVTNKLGDIDNDGDIDQIYSLGGRSFSIWNPAAVTPLVYDSKDDLERITSTSAAYSQFFNMSNTIANTAVKNRSDDKGPEPEGITVGKIGGRTYAFVGLERIGGVMVYDITNPASPAYVTYANSRTIAGGDRGTEGIFFVPASQSPNGKNLVILSNEISSTLSVFEIAACTAPGIASIANTGSTSICPGSFVKLYNTDNNAAYTRQWLKDGAVVAGATDSVYNATTSGSYRLVTFNSTGCVDTSAAITVTTIPAATVNLSVSANTVSETAGTVVTVTANASAPVCGNQTVSVGVTGTGITAGDYTLSNSTITIPDGQTTGSVTFTVANDNVVENTETAVLTISNPTGNIVLGGTTAQNISITDFVFTLQVLHASDFEAAVDAVADAPRFAAIVDTLEGTYANTIKLSSGDNYIPGPFLSSGEDPSLAAALKTAYESYYNTTFNSSSVNLLPSIGRADISILNFIGIEASALGNHEFDLGTTEVRNIIRGANSSATVRSWFGAQFPYLSANLNFSADGNLSAIATTNRLLPNSSFQSNPSESVSANTNKLKLAPSTIITKGGQKIGIVGATTQVLATISSPGATTVVGGGANDMTILAGILQPVINDLIADGCNKIILLSHLQQISFEKELAGKLNGVDIIMAGGSNTLMADANDRLRAGDVAVETYPFLTTGLDGKALAIINTDGNYKYVGRLVVDFDADGTLIPSSIDPLISGVYAADAQGVNDAWGANVGNAFAVGTRGYQVQLLCNAIGNVITVKDGNLFGKTSVFLEGRRNFVRTEETNLGNVSAEANLWMAKFYDPTTVISIKNGGGIRSAIGNVIAVGNNVTLTPPIANPSAGKQSGDISQLDIENSLRFNNQLSLVTLTASGMRSILENAVAATTATATPGQFAQVAGMRYSYNFSLAAGSRILNAVVTDAAGNTLDTLVLNGTTYGNLSRTFRVVTLNFLAGGGDGYPFNTLGTNRVDLNTVPAQGPALASFTNAGSEQDAFAEYMKNQFSTTPYGIAETALAQDCRIQRVPTRADNVLPPNPGTNGTIALGSATTVTAAQLFAALGGTPATGGTWSPAPAGAGVYTYTVTSPSCAGSASATVTVTGNAIPSVTISSPTVPANFTTNSTITAKVTATDTDGTIAKVELFVDGLLFGTDSIAPYTFTGANVAAGVYKVTAKATDNLGGTAETDTLVVTVADCTGSGSISGEGFTDISGAAVVNLTSAPKFINNQPDITASLGSFEYQNVADNYGGRVRGYICAPVTGNYRFWIAADEQATLYLSTDANPANVVPIAYTLAPSGFRQYAKYSSQISALIPLVKGARYFIQTLHKEASGADHLTVAWQLPNGTFEGPIPGSRLSPFAGTPLPTAGRVSGARNFAIAMESNSAVKEFKVTATPNPSNTYFTLSIKSNLDKAVSVKVMDAAGRLIETKLNAAANSTMQIGDKLLPGIYFVEVMQGNKIQRVKLVKQ